MKEIDLIIRNSKYYVIWTKEIKTALWDSPINLKNEVTWLP